MTEPVSPSPLQVKALRYQCRRNNDEASGCRQVLQRLLTAVPNATVANASGEIETTLEIRFANEAKSGDIISRQVFVRNGPCSPRRVVHASYLLPIHGPPFDGMRVSQFCWASFSSHRDHKVLCVLASPTILNVWDVYPTNDPKDPKMDGMAVSLPFEAVSIHPLGGYGIVIQRKESIEDHRVLPHGGHLEPQVDSKRSGKTPHMGTVPAINTSSNHLHMAGGINHLRTGMGAPALDSVPSLFTLSNPLDDVLPLAFIDTDITQQTKAMSDVFEKIIFVDNLEWSEKSDAENESTRHSLPVCVTYNTIKRRHAIWEIKCAPAGPPKVPLWKQTGKWRAVDGWNSHLGLLQQGIDDLEIGPSASGARAMDVNSNANTYNSSRNQQSRKEALAQALGVSKTPRKSVEEAATRTGRPSTSRRSLGRHNGPISLANTSLISPTSRSFHEPSMHNQLNESMDTVAGTQLLALGPFSSLHPKYGFRCIHLGGRATALTPATTAFLSANTAGDGQLTLSLIADPAPGSLTTTMELFSFQHQTGTMAAKLSDDSQQSPAMTQREPTFYVSKLPSIPCRCALPIKAAPIPLRLKSSSSAANNSRITITDMLVLEEDSDHKTTLAFYRQSDRLFECSLPNQAQDDDDAELSTTTQAPITGISNPVGNRFTIDLADDSRPSARCSLSLRMEGSLVCERAIGHIEHSLAHSQHHGTDPSAKETLVGLQFRVDCLRMHQHLQQHPQASASDNIPLSAVCDTIAALACMDLFEAYHTPNTATESLVRKASWEQLLCSAHHESSISDDAFSIFGTPSVAATGTSATALSIDMGLLSEATPDLIPNLTAMLSNCLHVLHEEMRLTRASAEGKSLASITSILTSLSEIQRLAKSQNNDGSISLHDARMQHYGRSSNTWHTANERLKARYLGSGNNELRSKTSAAGKPMQTEEFAPCIVSTLHDQMAGVVNNAFVDSIGSSFLQGSVPKLGAVVQAYSILFDTSESDQDSERVRRALLVLIQAGFKDSDSIRDNLPLGLAMPILDALGRYRFNPRLSQHAETDAMLLSLCGRTDLLGNLSVKVGDESKHQIVGASLDQQDSTARLPDADMDGIVPMEIASSKLFSNDNRMHEAGRLLRSSRPTFLRVDRPIEVSDHDFEALKQEKLVLLCRRVLALPVGRGMLTIGNLKPSSAEQLPLPDLCLVGRVPPSNALIALDMTEARDEPIMWPEFHNGVAAGLRLEMGTDAYKKITRTWIVYNRQRHNANQENPQNDSNSPNKNEDYSHGGLLMAMGLRGHLGALETSDIFDYLTYGTVTTTVGILLGMAINMRGTSDISGSKMICLHIPSLIPQHFSSIDVASSVQTAAIASAGLLYQGSSHRMMTEFLLNEIGRAPINDSSAFDREAYSLSCGIALGMVNLSLGATSGDQSRSKGLTDLRIEERLYKYISGTNDANLPGRSQDFADRNLSSTQGASGNDKFSCIFEGDTVNINVTAPGAILALAFMYMKSGNSSIASALELPDTHFLLSYVRPDFLLLRVVARSLILWDEVEGTQEWIQSQIPSVVLKSYEEMLQQIQDRTVMSQPDAQSKTGNKTDMQLVRQMYTHILAGACFALGLRFAGTGNKDIAAVIRERVEELLVLRDSSDPYAQALTPGRAILEMCLCCAATAASMVMAGSGDLETLRLLKVLRWRCDKEVLYGNHMAYGSAIGLLFLGGGTCTLGREPEDIAALVTAFYPRYPSSPSDNQYHLQALRHLYAIAVKKALINAVDVDVGKIVSVPIRITFADGSEPLDLKTPCLFHNTDRTPKELKLATNDLYPLRIPIHLKGSIGMNFFVKRRVPSELRAGTASGSLSQQLSSSPSSLPFFSFDDDRLMKTFTEFFGAPTQNQGARNGGNGHLSSTVARPGMGGPKRVDQTQDQLEMIQSCWDLSIMSTIDATDTSRLSKTWDFRLLASYYRHWLAKQSHAMDTEAGGDDAIARHPPLNRELVAYLYAMMQDIQSKQKHFDG